MQMLGAEADYVEFKAGYTLPSLFIKNLTTGTTVFYSPEYGGEVGEVWTTESVASYSLPKIGMFDPTISGLLGWEMGQSSKFNAGDDEYYYWNAGLTLGVENLSFDFRYWDSDLKAGAGLCGNANSCATSASCSAPPLQSPKQRDLQGCRRQGPEISGPIRLAFTIP